MAMIAGDETVVAGTLSRAIYDALNAEFGAAPTTPIDVDLQRRRASAAIAAAIVGHVTAKADLQFLPTHVGLQTSASPGSPTAGPIAPVTALAPVIL